MADVDHELGAIRHLVESPLSSKVAMFNNVAKKHYDSQLLNPFSDVDGRRSPRPQFSKDEYGKPVAGSLTEFRGQKANLHVYREMMELCDVINNSGAPISEENEGLKYIFFGELFNIYVHISDKVVGLLLRARKHKLIDFEGEVLFQRRDDDVPIFMLKTMAEIREYVRAKEDEVRRSISPNPQAMLMGSRQPSPTQ
ncbi:actin-binding Rho-activating protein [Phlebotomus argentipes]|uniref:actin-binding Rho-activating protein n=1 Tax=Phlebotomus argentipes TaxID=94469 RepID=UPI00289331AE|nr:actin-binding Rho-activating protein [Phlebotomus argentipes]